MFGRISRAMGRKPSPEEWFEAKSRAMEKVLGREHDQVMHALIPYAVGGTLDLYYYPLCTTGTGVATKELIDESGKGNSNRKHKAYELVMFTRHAMDLDAAQDAKSVFGQAHREISSALNVAARYGAQTTLNPNDTFEYPSDVAVQERHCYLFDSYEPGGKKLQIMGDEYGLLLVMCIHRSELEYARQRGTARLVEQLKEADAYPYSDLDRFAVGDLSHIEAADCWDEIGLGRLVPTYLQLHLAVRSPRHTLARRPDGTINTDDVPAMPFQFGNRASPEQAQADFLRMMNEKLPNDPEVLGVLTREEIVRRLCEIYRISAGNDMFSNVCRAWCAKMNLV